jgi:hypothetical protein
VLNLYEETGAGKRRRGGGRRRRHHRAHGRGRRACRPVGGRLVAGWRHATEALAVPRLKIIGTFSNESFAERRPR